MITAKLNSYRQSPRKMRLVADLIKGRNVLDALSFLKHTTKVAALPLAKLLQGAIANAKASGITDSKTLFVENFRVDAGKTLRRSMPRARGSAYRIKKRSSHITLVLDTKQDKKIIN